MARCPYRYYDNNSFSNPMTDNQCVYEEGHSSEHKKRELLPPTQPYHRLQGWIKDE